MKTERFADVPDTRWIVFKMERYELSRDGGVPLAGHRRV
jgi:hypothetical protein